MAYVSLDSQQIKKANKKHKYSKEQVEQLENAWILKQDRCILWKHS